MRIRWTMPAADDLNGIKVYLDGQFPHYSQSTIRKLYQGILSLRSMPDRGRVGLRDGTRELILPPLPYIVSYRVTREVIEILRIHHGAQDRTELAH